MGDAPAAMSTTVPEVILVGHTTYYRHFTRGSRDLYAPEAMLPDPPPQHVWSYCVSRDHNDTVFFHNHASGRSLWVLPRLAGDGAEAADGAEEVMQAIGSVESAATMRKHVAFGSRDEASQGDAAGRRAVMRQSIEKAVREAQAQRTAETVPTTAPAGPVSDEINNENNNTVHVRERLAVWRAKRAQQQQQQQQGGDAPVVSAQRDDVEKRVHHESPSLSGLPPAAATAQRASLLGGKISSQSSYHATAPREMEMSRGVQPIEDFQNVEKAPSRQRTYSLLERDIYDEKRRLFLEAHEKLQQEREMTLQQERFALERVARLQEAQQREEEERTRLATERRQLEQQRLELQKRALERQRELLVKVEEEAMQQELAGELDNFFETKSRLVQQAQAERRRLASFEEAIAESLLGTVTQSPTAPPKEERRIDLRLLDESDTDKDDSSNSSNNNKSNHRGVLRRGEVPNRRMCQKAAGASPSQRRRQEKDQQQRRCERITYGPSLVYVGDVTGGGRKPPSFLQRQGRGTFFYDNTQKYFFEGEWCNDKRHGVGALSLPHAALEGTWLRDQLEGRATFHTKRLKGTGEFKEGVLDGNVVAEIDCNTVFAGRVKKNAAIVDSGAITLASGDHVEWIRDDKKSHRGPRQQVATRSCKFPNGSGSCRIRFANGDVYVGQVENYQPHGTGTYRFAAEGQEYVGEFQHGRLQGRGTYNFANGSVYIGQFYKGVFHGEGQYVQRDDYTYEGSWEYGTAHGKGKLIFANGDVWEGEFDHDRRVTGRYTASHLFQL
ncbi:MORN repeat-containing protein [Trypanosoma rangeli]|uniref:MORN repeat-containing protein n=1 Tax=Trypanosoma rangeli TaxID=5698 RepID=A0A422NCL0_TRYRA|nr:MORN repeat-containing protein [Trypanosoma rangeli]RNF03172.1 MORN repeat-containing protein [Trypanosoma rangeli]|eukprot:RNF03172.1 MORN repeat-containing protein [Trypanosoma rangeli]